ncbi:U3 small nucleolar RNA-associated protein [Wickerhamomyces ciferrii]|uniref:U3 small nucleolar RNA-associated protein n=1 Tax=Wickerhamomyces ciferrii (strain ATCC 14091 / BCRC 22168 / CBS 111 / JCM 3599 / NBRC 0793 / NRRL Y-1031 F-60-10) TaxID=1206466 RepID=K0KT98_WICCF|nr:U3 small nucleolar RNA-associated protein [Wickerhamomyces ciferrii]CCH46381.1 U3 small nucleolar RNA-associated protein [Wickerhamomyces ciferrii]
MGSVPELEDLIKKGLFEKNEITMIMRRRTDFEHRINSRGSKARDYLKYVDFEKNLEKLRKKRYNRLSSVGLINTKPSISDWASERRILFILDRGVQKFPNEFQLWETLLQFAKEQKLFKKIYKIYTNLLQLHPTSINSWISAANFEYEYVGSAKNARILFQKGLRFNKDSKKLWLSYTIFELSYINKLINRRKILGLITEKQQYEHEKSEKLASKEQLENDEHSDLIQLSNYDNISNDELKTQLNSLPDADLNMLGNPETNPALKGDVALTIFDICIETLSKLKTSTFQSEFEFKYDISKEFLKIFDKFEDLNREYLVGHVVNYLLNNFNNELDVLILDITLPLRNLSINSENFIDNLQISTKKFIAYKGKLNSNDDKSQLKLKFSSYLIENFLQNDEIEDENIKQILHSIIKKL